MNRAQFLEQFKNHIGLKSNSLKNNAALIIELDSEKLRTLLKLCAAESGLSVSLLKAATLESAEKNKILNLIFMFPELGAEIILRFFIEKNEPIPLLSEVWPYARIWESEYNLTLGDSLKDGWDMGGVRWHQC